MCSNELERRVYACILSVIPMTEVVAYVRSVFAVDDLFGRQLRNNSLNFILEGTSHYKPLDAAPEPACGPNDSAESKLMIIVACMCLRGRAILQPYPGEANRPPIPKFLETSTSFGPACQTPLACVKIE